jgi:hypothetical protein
MTVFVPLCGITQKGIRGLQFLSGVADTVIEAQFFSSHLDHAMALKPTATLLEHALLEHCKIVILRVQIWSKHQSDVVGLRSRSQMGC